MDKSFIPKPTVCVSFNVDRAAAILAGNAAFGEQHAYIAPAELTEAQRAALSRCDFKRDAFVLVGYKTKIASAKDVDVPALLDEVAEHWRGVDERDLATRRHIYAESLRAAAKWLEEPDDRHVTLSYAYRGSGGRVTVTEIYPAYLSALDEHQAEFQDPRGAEFLQQYPARLEQARQLAARMQKHNDAVAADIASRRLIETERLAKEKEAREQRQVLQLSDWVDTHGTPSQKKRFQANLLPKDEILADMRKYAFSALDAFGRYVRMTKEDVLEEVGGEYDTVDDVEFDTAPAAEATDPEFEALEEIGQLIRRAYPDAKVELLDHRGETEQSKQYFSRKSIRVVIPFGDFEFTREYAAPLTAA
jgi:hypothetical protein